jgi:hypothetical protein
MFMPRRSSRETFPKLSLVGGAHRAISTLETPLCQIAAAVAKQVGVRRGRAWAERLALLDPWWASRSGGVAARVEHLRCVGGPMMSRSASRLPGGPCVDPSSRAESQPFVSRALLPNILIRLSASYCTVRLRSETGDGTGDGGWYSRRYSKVDRLSSQPLELRAPPLPLPFFNVALLFSTSHRRSLACKSC